MRSHSSSVMSPCVVRHVLLGCSGVFGMNISIVVASAPLVANGSFRSANFRNSLLECREACRRGEPDIELFGGQRLANVIPLRQMAAEFFKT